MVRDRALELIKAMFDNTCKFLAETFPADFANWLLGEPLPLTELKPTELSAEQIRADSLIFLQSQDLVLHLEFQTRPNSKMASRMLDYATRIYLKFPQKQLRQVVIYLLPTTSSMVYETAFVTANTRHEFGVIRLWEQSPEILQRSPGLLPLAVLGKTAQPENILRQVAQQIERIEDKTQRSNVASSAAVLAGLVLKQEVVQRVLRSDIMRESSVYQAILAEGEAKGRAEGRAEGEAKIRQVARNMLRSGMSIATVAQLTELTVAEVESLQEQQS